MSEYFIQQSALDWLGTAPVCKFKEYDFRFQTIQGHNFFQFWAIEVPSPKLKSLFVPLVFHVMHLYSIYTNKMMKAYLSDIFHPAAMN